MQQPTEPARSLNTKLCPEMKEWKDSVWQFALEVVEGDPPVVDRTLNHPVGGHHRDVVSCRQVLKLERFVTREKSSR